MTKWIDRLDQIQARADAATPGPWMAGSHYGDPYVSVGALLHEIDYLLTETGCEQGFRYADFIATASKDVPEMLEALQRIAALNTGNNRELYGVDFEAGMAKALWMVRAAMAHALHVDMMD